VNIIGKIVMSIGGASFAVAMVLVAVIGAPKVWDQWTRDDSNWWSKHTVEPLGKRDQRLAIIAVPMLIAGLALICAGILLQ
jgi:hypothetical protein